MWYLWEDDPTREGRYCYECGYFFEWDNFHRLRHGRNGRESVCKQCKRVHAGWRSRCRRRNERPDACEECGVASRQLQVDHCHDTMTFRAWVCCPCNLQRRRW